MENIAPRASLALPYWELRPRRRVTRTHRYRVTGIFDMLGARGYYRYSDIYVPSPPRPWTSPRPW